MSLVPLKTVHIDVRWYGDVENGETTADGEIFDANYGFTYASSTDDFGTLIRVYNDKGNWVQCRCNDRGPNRVELNAAAFREIAPLEQGVIRDAKIEYYNVK